MLNRSRFSAQTGRPNKRNAGKTTGYIRHSSGVWVPSYCDGVQDWYDGAVFRGVVGSRPAVATVHDDATCFLTSDAISGITPRSMRQRASRLADNSRAWVYDGRQVLFAEAGQDGSPVRTVTAAAASGTIGTLGTIPGSWWIQNGTRLYIEALLTRGATATGTATMGIALNGTTIWSVAAVAAAATRVVMVWGMAWAVSSTTQVFSGTLTPLTSAAIGASTGGSITATSDISITATFSAATVSDIFEVGAFTISLE